MARRFKKPSELIDHQLKRLRYMRATVKDGVEYMRQEGLRDAIELTGGGIKKRTLRAMGSPYGRGRSAKGATPTGRLRGSRKGRAPLLPINLQSGRLRRSMMTKPHTRLGFDVLSKGVPYAQYILSTSGTRKMVTRPLKKEAIRRLNARRAGHIQYFVRKQRTF